MAGAVDPPHLPPAEPCGQGRDGGGKGSVPRGQEGLWQDESPGGSTVPRGWPVVFCRL